ncbi:chemotaxis protein CheW [Geobacter benzoatilyticus]|uniref:Purine-binding chemotaxis protein CheW n=1 Tax=Geobacter benzoatilyticus TaxID=2815309 RepID=A0ABX7PZD3_9BACT|nr:chemotaxis protein CheW [Geobacter benzoatilyticus]QSV44499.1 purine-binding chemotaxis protein CheW [Geobacter benzoatilyticus]
MTDAHSAKPAKDIDWDEIRRRLETARAALASGVSPEEEARILKTRAAALARDSRPEETAAGQLEILEFLLAYERYGIEMSCVRETCPLKDLTPLPCTPPFVLGLINVRGEIVSVIDLKKFFDLPEKGLTDLNKVIIVHDEDMTFGILADEILGVRLIPDEGTQPSLPTLTGIRDEYLKGITGERTIILDGKRILNDSRIIVQYEE